MKKVTRRDAIRILNEASDHDDPHWENVTQDWYDEADDTLPSVVDVFAALGVPEEQFRKAVGWGPKHGLQPTIGKPASCCLTRTSSTYPGIPPVNRNVTRRSE